MKAAVQGHQAVTMDSVPEPANRGEREIVLPVGPDMATVLPEVTDDDDDLVDEGLRRLADGKARGTMVVDPAG